MLTGLANILTLSRIAMIPLLIGAFYIDGDLGNWTAAALFSAAGVTDFFDGYVARARDQRSSLGSFLDPVADKLLVAATILMLVAFDRIAGLVVLPALVILCREILVSGMREFLAQTDVSVPVSRLAKWKTALQMFALGFLLVGDAGPAAIPTQLIGEVGLWAAAAITLLTGYDYLRDGAQHLMRAGTIPQGDAARPSESSRRSS